MKYILTLLVLFSLAGCTTIHDAFCSHDQNIVYVDKPVWTPPAINMPTRPVLKSINNSSLTGSASSVLDTTTKNIQTDTAELSTYAEKLEGIIETVKATQPVSSVKGK